ncbi:MAG: phosphatidylglycerophosphatase A [Halobacteriovoraceae bacterium]|nr:phosphatidylglycerophosphatase A [Halobacteriovoraceae bacterium]
MKSKRINIKRPEILFASCMGLGFIPKLPGTIASLAILPCLYLLGIINFPVFFLFPLLLLLVIPSCFVVEHIQNTYKIHDPSWIVIDEIFGMTIAWFFVQSPHWTHLIVIFFLFRFFDIYKLWPASFFDKCITHGAGTILDDIISGIQAGICYFIGLKILIAW